jgi:hypothetical protein
MESSLKDFSLRRWRPNNVTRPITMAEARSIENDDAIILGSQIDQTTGFEILDHAAVAVQQDQRRARAPLDIVEPDSVYFEESTSVGIVVFRITGQAAVREGRYCQSTDSRDRPYGKRVRLSDRTAFKGKRP